MNFRRASLLLGISAVIAMTGMTACSPRVEKPAETKAPSSQVSPTDKVVRTNVTRAPMSVSPNGGGGGNAAVPCGFGPSGGATCGRGNN